MQRLYDPDSIFADGIFASALKYYCLFLRNTASNRDIFRGNAPIDHSTASAGDIRSVHNMIMMCMRDKDGLQSVYMMKSNEFITQSFICFHLRAGDVFPNGRPGKMRVKKDLILSVIKQKSCCPKKRYFQHVSLPRLFLDLLSSKTAFIAISASIFGATLRTEPCPCINFPAGISPFSHKNLFYCTKGFQPVLWHIIR